MKISKGNLIRTSITLDKEVAEIGKRNAEKRGFGHSFSAYISWLIIRDSRGAVLREDISETQVSSNPSPSSLTSQDPFDN